MAVSLDRSSPSLINKKSSISMESSPLLSPYSDNNLWKSLQTRVDTLLENRQLKELTGETHPDPDLPPKAQSVGEDCLLLLKGFDSISSSLSQLKGNLDTALQGTKDLSNTSLIELPHTGLGKPDVEEEEERERIVKRKHESHQLIDEDQEEQSPNHGKLKKARKLAISMATNAASLARELKSIKSDLSFMQERCALLEEENKMLRDGSEKGLRLEEEEDDLVRLQLEALLEEKSRLANEKANLIRENRCLHQLVEYHQLTSSQEDFSESYGQVVRGMCLDFSSSAEEEEEEEEDDETEAHLTPQTDTYGFSNCLDQYSNEEQN